jgi:phosphoesterase RecJ-like protein
MVTELMVASPWGIEPDEAEALYVAMVSDNGGFRFASTTLKSHDCAMVLLRAGVMPGKVSDKLESNMPLGALRLWGRAMSRAETFAGGLAAIYWLEASDFGETGAPRDATENLVNFLLRLKGVKMAALCSESPSGEPPIGEPLSGESPDGVPCRPERNFRVSVRARSPYNAREVAARFGGGGHDLAAGCSIGASSAREAVSLVKEEISRHVSRISADR